MNNEPVAWAIKSDGDFTEIGWDDEVLYEVEEWYTAQGWQYEHIPLYTHPAELTDRIAELEKQLDTRTRELIGASFYEHDYKTLMAKPPLTDKEIEEVAVINLGHSMGLLNWMGFARAILRKAQEK